MRHLPFIVLAPVYIFGGFTIGALVSLTIPSTPLAILVAVTLAFVLPAVIDGE